MRRALVLLATMALAIVVAGGTAMVGVEEPAEAAFPGENGRVAYTNYGDTAAFPNPEGDSEIYTVKPDGTGVKRLTNNAAQDSYPAYSADGKKIAFIRAWGLWFDKAEIYTMNADGSAVRRLTDNDTNEWDPTWSPDGKKIAFSGSNGIYLMEANGSGVKRIIENCVSDQCYKVYYSPDWSPDGTKLALGGSEFLPGMGDAVKSIYTVNADGSGLKRITNQDTTNWADANGAPDHNPDWSPDGEKIVYESKLGDYGIYAVDADGSSGERAIYAPTQNNEIEAVDPVWSPDGKKIAFGRTLCVTFFDCTDGVYTVTPDGSGLTKIIDTLERPTGLDWQALPASEPQSKAECKNGGYKEFGFKNQGRCIAFVNRAAHTQ